MAASAIQLEANRANAQLSTGPRTEEGKKTSSKNATTTGLTSAQIFVRPEEESVFAEFKSTLTDELKPNGLTQSGLFNLILHASWNIRHCFELEADIQSEAMAKGLKDALLDDDLARKLDRIYRYRKMHESSHRRAIADLRKLKTEELFRGASQRSVDESILTDTQQIIDTGRKAKLAGGPMSDEVILQKLEAFCAPPPLSARVRRQSLDRMMNRSHSGE
jgi:hypothetical protein